MFLPRYNVVDLRYLSRLPDPDFYPSSISDPRSQIQQQQQKRREKQFVV
jgi:hypothetical protein